ncbi:MAG: hypothetical protein MHMPM18_001272 [Marteilia pararefringens]
MNDNTKLSSQFIENLLANLRHKIKITEVQHRLPGVRKLNKSPKYGLLKVDNQFPKANIVDELSG